MHMHYTCTCLPCTNTYVTVYVRLDPQRGRGGYERVEPSATAGQSQQLLSPTRDELRDDADDDLDASAGRRKV